jgi:hypothetical protein
MSLARRVGPTLPFVGTLLLGTGLLVSPPPYPDEEPGFRAPVHRSADGTRPPPVAASIRPAPRATPPTSRLPEQVSGWWGTETWADGSTGHWTTEDASLRVERREGENDLLLDMSFSHPTNLSTGFIEVNDRRMVRLRNVNGRRRMILPLGLIPGRVLVVRFVAERPFVGQQHRAASGDARRLGFFVHEVRLLPRP